MNGLQEEAKGTATVTACVRAGSRLGRYQVLSRIEAGAMGEVYRARDARLEREVAVKVLPGRLHSEARRRRFQLEGRAIGALSHPNVLAVYDVGEDGGLPYMVTELLEGETLRSLLSRGSLPRRKATDFAIQIARGLAAVHERGIVHRDLKPANLFVTRDSRVKILDFGLARLVGVPGSEDGLDEEPVEGAPEDTPTQPGAILGTLNYMSPEQVQGLPADHRSDIFALGAVTFEMLAGAKAFLGPTVLDTMNGILKADPLELTKLPCALPPGLSRVLGRCLEKNPWDRFQSSDEVAFALEITRDEGGVADGRAGLLAAFAFGLLAGASSRMRDRPGKGGRRRRSTRRARPTRSGSAR
jgi:serine/threonine protein kinase